MSKLLEQAIAEARKLPEAEQELAAEALYSAISTDPVSRLTPAQADEVRRIRAAMREGTARFATDEEMAAFWKRCGL